MIIIRHNGISRYIKGHSTRHRPERDIKFCKVKRSNPWSKFADTPKPTRKQVIKTAEIVRKQSINLKLAFLKQNDWKDYERIEAIAILDAIPADEPPGTHGRGASPDRRDAGTSARHLSEV
jgi:hypothetical protein